MSEAEKFSLATHLYVRLRRTANRVIDAVWMARNDEYAREILELARSFNEPELLSLVQRFEALLPGGPAARTTPAPSKPAAAAPVRDGSKQTYIGTLR
ncbi:MAG: hypothetical protein JWR16_593 [Nevskia sp.]|nr:hypothetical protein [Nevskia sp.]